VTLGFGKVKVSSRGPRKAFEQLASATNGVISIESSPRSMTLRAAHALWDSLCGRMECGNVVPPACFVSQSIMPGLCAQTKRRHAGGLVALITAEHQDRPVAPAHPPGNCTGHGRETRPPLDATDDKVHPRVIPPQLEWPDGLTSLHAHAASQACHIKPEIAHSSRCSFTLSFVIILDLNHPDLHPA
jgi:hypothetical protein